MAKSKRLRKKLYLDEFAVHGFEVSASCASKDEERFNQFIDGFLEYIENRGLLFGGGGSTESFEGFVISNQRYGSPSEEDRNAIQEWLGLPCSGVSVGELVDANYGH